MLIRAATNSQDNNRDYEYYGISPLLTTRGDILEASAPATANTNETNR